MKMNLKNFLSKVKLTIKKDSSWNEYGYKTIQFRDELEMTHRKLGDFAWINQSEIEIEIPDDLINKPVETTNEQPKIKCTHPKRKGNTPYCRIYKGRCTCKKG